MVFEILTYTDFCLETKLSIAILWFGANTSTCWKSLSLLTGITGVSYKIPNMSLLVIKDVAWLLTKN